MTKPRAASTPAIAALERAGVPFVVREYPAPPEGTPDGLGYGLEAAKRLGIDPAQILKTLMVRISGQDGRLVVGVVPVAGHLDIKALARTVGGKKGTMASPEEAERATGYVVGGISPLGQRTTHATVLDESVMGFERIYVSGGRRRLDVGLAPADLVRVTGATVARIATD